MNASLLNEEWDYLIILDACRYDYFEALWKDYLPPDGHLMCRESVGSCTNEWRDKLFPDYYEDIIYITANPQINLSMPVFGYCAKDHFKYVHEIWKDGWNTQHGTVLPETVTRRALEIIPRYEKNKKFIIHYIQPHAPYIYSRKHLQQYSLEQFLQAQTLITDKKIDGRIKRTLYRFLLTLFKKSRLWTNQPEWFLRKFLRVAPTLPMEAAWRRLGTQGLKEAYEANLKAVLPHVSVLMDSLKGSIVVTSDHGEFLGENRRFGHPAGSSDPFLRNIPWYTLKKMGKVSKPKLLKESHSIPASLNGTYPNETKEQDQVVIDRLRALGYYE